MNDDYLIKKDITIKLSSVIMNYQFIEEGLKIYLEKSFELIRQKLNDELPFEYNRATIEKYPMGKLIKAFDKHSNNKELVKKLEALPEKRNDIAHKGFVAMFHEDYQGENLYKMKEALSDFEKESKSCRDDVFKEIKALEKSF